MTVAAGAAKKPSPAISKKGLGGVSLRPPHTPHASSASGSSSPNTTVPLQSVHVLLASHRMCEHTPQASGSQGGGLIGGDGGLGGAGGDGGGGGFADAAWKSRLREALSDDPAAFLMWETSLETLHPTHSSARKPEPEPEPEPEPSLMRGAEAKASEPKGGLEAEAEGGASAQEEAGSTAAATAGGRATSEGAPAGEGRGAGGERGGGGRGGGMHGGGFSSKAEAAGAPIELTKLTR